jgi:glycosyltransferase involved in cell wall biosynthesis
LRVLHLSQSDREGGANRAAFRLHQQLVHAGVVSTFHSGRKFSDDDAVVPAAPGPFGRLRSTIVAYLNARALKRYPKRQGAFSPIGLSYGRPSRSLIDQADVVCLHWIAGAFLRPRDLAAIGRPLVWRLSDLWPFTGGCHFAGACERFEATCGRCPVLGSAADDDLSASGHAARRAAYPGLNLTIVAPSTWIAEQARRSSLFRQRRIEHIATGADLTIFKPSAQAAARDALGLPAAARVILFGAFGGLDDPRKGFADLKAALRILATGPSPNDLLLVVFGGSRDDALRDSPVPVRPFGVISDESRLALLYAAADVLVAPSREDNLPNVVIEALACGTPVVGFDAGGMRDAIVSGVNGFLAQIGSAETLARAILQVLSQPLAASMRHQARASAEERFDLAACARRYHALFEEIVEMRHISP